MVTAWRSAALSSPSGAFRWRAPGSGVRLDAEDGGPTARRRLRGAASAPIAPSVAGFGVTESVGRAPTVCRSLIPAAAATVQRA